jgi:hypothetical protein
MYIPCFFRFTPVQFASAFPVYDIFKSVISSYMGDDITNNECQTSISEIRVVFCQICGVACGMSMLLSHQRETLSAGRAERFLLWGYF